MNKWIAAFFGAGFFGAILALRTYLGIALVLMVTTCSFKADILNYIKESKEQAHQERLAEIQAQTVKAKLDADEKTQLRAIMAEERKRALVEQQKQPSNVANPTFQMMYSNGDTYAGEGYDNIRNGYGTYVFANGNRYVGYWTANQKNGYGTFYYPNGEHVSGTFVANFLEGPGKYVWADSSYWTGNFTKGYRNGYGVQYNPQGQITLQGYWENDRYRGS